MLVGYARVSSTEQETALQRDALARAGVEHLTLAHAGHAIARLAAI